MWKKILNTDNTFTGTVLRLTLTIMMLPMGVLKIINFTGMTDILQTNYSLPYIIAVIVILIEFFVPLFLIVGLGSRIGVVLLTITMFYHTQYGYHMNWYGLQDGEGYQFHLLAIGTSIGLTIIGGGRWSLDKFFIRKMLDLKNTQKE